MSFESDVSRISEDIRELDGRIDILFRSLVCAGVIEERHIDEATKQLRDEYLTMQRELAKSRQRNSYGL